MPRQRETFQRLVSKIGQTPDPMELIGPKSIILAAALLHFAFDFSNASIPPEEIVDGGPPKDGIPALFDPEFVLAEQAEFLKPDDRVLGLVVDGKAKAYPLRILNWHEVVNDRIGGKPVLVSYCPLCGTGMAFDAKVGTERLPFGVSGKLYNNDVLFYDKKTDSLWSQLRMEAVTGPLRGTRLNLLPLEHTTWESWRRKHSDTLVLSLNTGHFRDYRRDPYEGYGDTERVPFPLSREDPRLPRKAWVVGVVISGKAKAYPFARLQAQSGPIADEVGGKKIWVHYDSDNQSAVVEEEGGEVVPSVQAYWFAWAAFYPETALYE